MKNIDLSADEVILFEGTVTSPNMKGQNQLTLTSMKLVVERERGVFKKERELVDIVKLSDIKMYNGVVQIKQKGNSVELQTVKENMTLSFSVMVEAKKFSAKVIDAVTGTTFVQRGSEKIKEAIGVVDDTLGLDTRNTIKGVLEHGIKGTLLNGIAKKK